MIASKLYNFLEGYFPNNPGLMNFLKPGAMWEYIIKSPNLDGEQSQTVLTFHLLKQSDDSLEMVEGPAPAKPDLILYFTEKAILNIITGSPPAEQYYDLYRKIMTHPTEDMDIDYKINKSRLKLWRKGYRLWSKIYKFSHIRR
ncbi:MAG: hypothetical protein HWN66_08090 [Candidatus Helarchaeota archaeon]|nr:hypothetical protein [Candidatus Helarchaeota archaeon]